SIFSFFLSSSSFTHTKQRYHRRWSVWFFFLSFLSILILIFIFIFIFSFFHSSSAFIHTKTLIPGAFVPLPAAIIGGGPFGFFRSFHSHSHFYFYFHVLSFFHSFFFFFFYILLLYTSKTMIPGAFGPLTAAIIRGGPQT